MGLCIKHARESIETKANCSVMTEVRDKLLGSEMVSTLAEVNRDVTESMDMRDAINSTIAHVWPTRKRRIAHDMIVINFVKLVDDLLGYMQVILILHALATAGRNWDHLPSIDKVFLPTFVSLGGKLFIFFVSFIWAWFSFVSEGGDPKLMEYDELHRLVRLSYHAMPVIFHSLAFLFFYAVVHCHLNNANRGRGICKAFDLELITVALCLVIGAKILHYILNFYQIFKHTQQPVRRRTFRSTLGGASIPLLGGFGQAGIPRSSFGPSSRPVSSFVGAPLAAPNSSAIPALSEAPSLPNTANTAYSMGYDYGSGTPTGPV